MNARRHSTRRRQSGVSLAITLVLLLVVTLLGLAVLRGTGLEEHMSANLLDRTYQFEAAETTLRQAEALIVAGVTVPTSGCSSGVCAAPTAGATDRWLDSSFSGWTTATGTANHDSTITSQYFIEYMGDGAYGPDCTISKSTASATDPNCDMLRYRVTARSEGDGRASVILQSNYLMPQ